jgi:hypothetical protein
MGYIQQNRDSDRGAIERAAKSNTVAQQFSDQRESALLQLQQQKMMAEASSQRMAVGDEEELLQGKFVTQRQGIEDEEELLQGKFEPAQRAEKVNETGIPDHLKAGIESLSGFSMDHVRVHYNSDKPAQLNAHAYAQGSEIHLAPGQEQHLPHEAWHVVQQMQGRVKPTMQMKGGVPVNDDMGLEREADLMGQKALQMKQNNSKTQLLSLPTSKLNSRAPVQRVWIEGSAVLDLGYFKGYPLSYLRLRLPETSSFNLSYNAYQQQEECDFLPLHNVLMESLQSNNRFPIELIINQATQWLQARLPDVEDDDIVNDQDHPEGSGEEEILEPEEVDAEYWSKEWLERFFCNLNVVKERINIAEQAGLQVAKTVFDEWMGRGVMTRAQIAELVEKEKIERIQKDGQGTTQLARGAGASGPKSYVSATVGPYVNVTYTRDGDGYFDFKSPSNRVAWSDPIKGGKVDMEKGCTKAGYGIMKDNMTKVKLQTATRAQHFSIANRICGISGSGSPAGYTWHHLKDKYKMVLVDRKVHQQHGHNGGIFLWR